MNKIVLSAFLVFLLAFAHVQANPMAEKISMAELMAAVKHANPLPNFMRVIQQHKNELDLSEEQNQDVETWIGKHRPTIKELVLSIREGEKALAKAALDGATKEDMMKQLEGLLEKRREIASIKMDCRDKMRELLGEDKWQQIVELYKNM
jgi:4-hydroxyphenylpyruvate dioxygenase-like putative hemolysin